MTKIIGNVFPSNSSSCSSSSSSSSTLLMSESTSSSISDQNANSTEEYVLDNDMSEEMNYNSHKAYLVDADPGDDSLLWHARLGHVSPVVMKHIIKNSKDYEVNIKQSTAASLFCEACAKGKARRQPLHHRDLRYHSNVNKDMCDNDHEKDDKETCVSADNVLYFSSKKPLEKLHLDTIGKFKTAAFSDEQYITTITCDSTRHRWIILSKSKDEIAGEVKTLIVTLMRQYDQYKIKTLHWDRGSEFCTAE